MISVIGEGVGDGKRELYVVPSAMPSGVTLKLLLLFCARDQAQLDAASVSSIQVVGVVEALIQSTDTLFPGGDVLSSCHL